MNPLEFKAELFKCLSDQARIQIIELLLKKKRMYVTEIQKELGFTQAKTSRHIIYLKKAGVLSLEQEPNANYYLISDDYKKLLKSLLGTFGKN
ncbi:ArsR/SmtB family transcription factor [Xanthovirga aplysinae]|uniref:ArsR/SmtB family transcription factor n=1 Tax=Xanthovirga aplysinae TaxID=2529853 RepID=UPI0012BB88B2|nr:metalloregulator ArsR/SmtB family transcription factor [Xanthovirga aplysinae]MTI31293.1 ArsR family transcriptional regulator [Xanthovirga aplysinae]